jgi:hypothetical protein
MKFTHSLTNKPLISYVIALCFFGLSANTYADEQVKINIPVVDGARIFAQFDDEIPAVVNYFTSAEESKIISFYNESYGEIVSRERKRGRLTLNYLADMQSIRVIISQQNKSRQVDVIVDKQERSEN